MRRADGSVRLAIAVRFKAGESVTALARDLDLSRSTIRRILAEQGAEVRRYVALTPGRRAFIVDRYRAGESIRTLAKVLGISFGSVQRAVVDAGVVRPRGGAR